MMQAAEGAAWEKRAVRMPSRFYSFLTDLEAADAEHLAGHMDAVFGSYMAIFSKMPVQAKQPARLSLYLFAAQRSYDGFLAYKFGNDGTGSWGKCIQWGQTYWLVGWKGDHSLHEMQSLLQHEGFHQVAGQIFPDLPLWANEGMAELFERGIVVGDRLALGEISRADYGRLHAAIEQDALIPFDRFFSMSDREWAAYVRSGHAGLNYLQSWSLVHFLLYAENGKYEQGFMKFLVNLNRDMDWKRAFVGAFGTPDFRVMEREWLDYIKKEIPTDYAETVRRLDFLAAGVARLAEDKVFPSSLQALKEELRKANFEHESNLYSEERTFSAKDEEPFVVPGAADDPSRRFVLVDRRNRPLKADARRRMSQPPKLLALGRMPKVFTATIVKRGRGYKYALAAEEPFPIDTKAEKAKASKTPEAAKSPDKSPDKSPVKSPDKSEESNPDTAAKQEDDGPGFRTWHSADGRFSVEARLSGVLGDTVLLKKRDGKTIKVPRAKLSEGDRAFLEEREE